MRSRSRGANGHSPSCRGSTSPSPSSAPFAVPRFDNTAVDGYALRLADIAQASPDNPVALKIAGQVRAGERPPATLAPGTALKVMTGAPLGGEVDAVVMHEDTTISDDAVQFRAAARPGENIRRAGEEFRAGQTVFAHGTKISPPVIGLLASFGLTMVPAYDTPRVALVVTGDEIVTPGHPLELGQIYDSNSAALAAACRALGVSAVSRLHSQDDLHALTRDLERALFSADVVITVGGASAGDFDYVLPALRRLGVSVHHARVAMKPGKPNLFATLVDPQDPLHEKLIFGLPGNPVAALLSFHLFVRPALLLMMGATDVEPLCFSAMLGGGLTKKPGRLEFVRARLAHENGSIIAYPTRGQESHMLGGLAPASGLIHFPAASEHLAQGQSVLVELLSWS